MEQQEKKEHIPFYKKWWFWVLVVVIIFWFLSLTGSNVEKQTSSTMDNIRDQVASDAVAQYNIAKRQGDKIQICVQVGLVSAAYLQAQNESSYQSWKDIQKTDCRNAGMPQ